MEASLGYPAAVAPVYALHCTGRSLLYSRYHILLEEVTEDVTKPIDS
jgi:hypothetical protein